MLSQFLCLQAFWNSAKDLISGAKKYHQTRAVLSWLLEPFCRPTGKCSILRFVENLCWKEIAKVYLTILKICGFRKWRKFFQWWLENSECWARFPAPTTVGRTVIIQTFVQHTAMNPLSHWLKLISFVLIMVIFDYYNFLLFTVCWDNCMWCT